MMFFKVLVLLFLFNITNAKDVTNRSGWPDYQFYPSIDGWLKLHVEPTDYQDARMNCHLEDALLASEWNSEFTTAINKMMSSLGTEESPRAVYSGAQVTFTDGVYRYVKGELKLTPRDDLEELERCLVFSVNGSTVEVDCQEQFPYICYAPMPACGDEASHGYTLGSQTGHCYKFHDEDMNWTQAYKTCRAEGAYLAIVNSDAEAQFLKGLFPSDRANIAAVGFYYWTPAASWLTIHGQTIEQAGYATWTSGEPTSGAYFGYIHRDGELYSHHISQTNPFICEKQPSQKL